MKHRMALFSISLIVIFSMLIGLTASSAQALPHPEVDMGEPGLSYRYVETLGEIQVPYLADTIHLNGPMGLYMDDDDNLFVTEEQGYRLLKYNPTPTNVWAIGSAGNSAWTIGWGEYIFNLPRDVSLDNDGNIWVADGNRVVEYTSVGDQVFYDQEFYGDENHPLSDVWGIAFDSAGRMFISDNSRQVIWVYSFIADSPVYSATIGIPDESGDDDSHFNQPRRIDMDDSDRLYVADSNNGRAQQCVFSDGWGCTTLDSGLDNPQGLVVDDNNDLIYIASTDRIRSCTYAGDCIDFTTSSPILGDLAVDSSGNVYGAGIPNWDHNYNSTVIEYNSAGDYIGSYLGVVNVPYLTDDYHYNRPKVSLDQDQNIIITEEYGHRVVKLDPAGVSHWSFGVTGIPGDDEDHLALPMITAADSNGNIYVPNAWTCQVTILSPEGDYANSLGTGCGAGDSEFDFPMGIAIDSSNNIYVADTNNQRIMIYDQDLVFIGQIGETGICDAADDHLCWPQAVTVDESGDIYITDSGNNRIQKFNSDLQLVMTIGTGTWGNQFDQFATPNGIAVDAQGKIYVSEWENPRVQVFDSEGAYLTTIGGAWGSGSSQFSGISSVAVDNLGNVLISDVAHRIQVYTPGVPDWLQVNINGFGSPTVEALSITPFDGQLYASTGDWTFGSQIWRTNDGTAWEAATEPGYFGDGINFIFAMIEFNGELYAGTGWGEPPQILRSTNGSDWTQVMTTTEYNPDGIYAMTVYGDQIYAAIANTTEDGGVSILRSSSGDAGSWSEVVQHGNGDINNDAVWDFATFNNHLYAIGRNLTGGAFVWQASEDGETWTLVNQPGFDETMQPQAESMAVFNDELYVGTFCYPGYCQADYSELWKTSNGTDWSRVETPFSNNTYRDVNSLVVLDGALFAVVAGGPGGITVWRTFDGEMWTQTNIDGWGDINNDWSLFDRNITTFNDQLYVATTNWGTSGAKIWRYEPMVIASFTAQPISGRAPLEVTFTNTSTGTLNSSLWNFGDGFTSNLTSPVHTYEHTGVYSVTLTADSFGNIDTITKSDLITVENRQFFLPVIRR